jgi:hypothetical protein
MATNKTVSGWFVGRHFVPAMQDTKSVATKSYGSPEKVLQKF